MNKPPHQDKAQLARPRSNRTASKEVRKLQLIEATVASIAQHGISGTTMNTVTKNAGLSVGIVNFHFESKEKLFEETLRHLANEHREIWKRTAAKADLAPADRLLSIVEAEFHPDICRRDKLTVWTSFYAEAGYRASYRRIVSQIDTERWEASKALCAQIIKDGGYSDLNAHEIAETVEGLFDGFCLNILIYPDKFTNVEAKARVQSFLATTFPQHFDKPKDTGRERK